MAEAHLVLDGEVLKRLALLRAHLVPEVRDEARQRLLGRAAVAVPAGLQQVALADAELEKLKRRARRADGRDGCRRRDAAAAATAAVHAVCVAAMGRLLQSRALCCVGRRHALGLA
eukprot:331185-Chlamydomonas_euryale.AAC.1